MTSATIRELLSYRLHRVANLLSRGAELRYRREFGVSLWEWRTVALLGGAARRIAQRPRARGGHRQEPDEPRRLGPDRKKIVLRETDASDGRGIRLSLTPAGKKLYQKLIAAAAERNSAFLGCLSARERDCLEQAMTKLAREAKSFIQKEHAGRPRPAGTR